MSDTKVCTQCKCEHPLDYFPWQWQKKKPGKRRAWCKACNAEKSSAYYLKNRAECDRKARARTAKTPWKAVERKRRWRKDNPEAAIVENHYHGVKWHREQKGKKNRIGDYLAKKYTGVPCLDCGDVYEWCAMDFDHRPEEVKGFTVSRHNSYKRTLENIMVVEDEITRCDLVCSNCHRVRTHLLRQHKTHNSPNAKRKK